MKRASQLNLMKKRILKKIKRCAAMEMNKKNSLRNQLALARKIADELPEVIILRALDEGKIIYKRRSIRRIRGFKSNSTPKLSLDDKIQSSGYDSTSDNDRLEDENGCKEEIGLKSISVIRRELQPESNLGWPLLRRSGVLDRDDSGRSKAKERSMSLVEWVMNLPSRSSETIMENQIDEFDSKTESCSSTVCENRSVAEFLEESEVDDQSTEATSESQFEEKDMSMPENLPEKVEIVLRLKSSGCKQFSYKDLERATCRFSSENLIGEGGCSNVYKGRVCWGKQVAVKVLKDYKEAWNDFCLEVEIMSSLQHKHITHLIGACMEDDHLILVYDFLSKGSLEEVLRGQNYKSIMPWKVRFKLAIGIAEALNYLHNQCSPPVIHRDVKSSNILLSDDLQPRLSDFGLAIWGAADSAYTMCSDIVGTFGYIAPEYFIQGRVSNKIDIYSFGVVLLELLTGNKPVSSTGPKGQESLVKWAMPLLESGNLEALLDPKLGGEFDIVQMQRMVLAATLCIKRSPRLRPNASQILELLREEKQVRKWMNNYVNYLIESSHEECDELTSEAGQKQSSDSSLLVLKEDGSSADSGNTPLTIVVKKHRLRLKDYLKEQHD
ncbi:protein kinase STUNTED-like isoform X2 [Euphorbia lathyris]|uniref:protein kinase STUNTED-like isoform X2 n=1 Tax=Euphorbia lathyris TaxID=212925 RepID=UPI0033130FBD